MSDDEKENPWADWPEYTEQPWEMFEKLAKYHLFEKHGVCSYKAQQGPFVSNRNYNTTEERLAQPITNFEERPMAEMLQPFFLSKQPVYVQLGMHVDQFIVWAVTCGKYRSDSKKRIWVHQGTHNDILKYKHGDSALWHKVSEDHGFHIIKKITETCNLLYDMILQKLTRHDSKSKCHACCLENLRNLPEFVQFQSYRKPAHKEFKWHFQPRGQGGNKPDLKPAKSVRKKKHSIHRALLKYHFWLEPLKNK